MDGDVVCLCLHASAYIVKSVFRVSTNWLTVYYVINISGLKALIEQKQSFLSTLGLVWESLWLRLVGVGMSSCKQQHGSINLEVYIKALNQHAANTKIVQLLHFMDLPCTRRKQICILYHFYLYPVPLVSSGGSERMKISFMENFQFRNWYEKNPQRPAVITTKHYLHQRIQPWNLTHI